MRVYALVLCSCLCVDCAERGPSERAASAASQTITAKELFHAYEKNEIAAEQRYQGHVYVITGTISNIGKDILGAPFVTFDIGGESTLFTVQAMFPKNAASQLAALEKSQPLKARCRIDGKLGSLIVRECAIVR